MGWFENQIEERREADQQLLEDSLVRVAGVVVGDNSANQMIDDRIRTKNAINQILSYYHYKSVEIPKTLQNIYEQIDYCMSPYGLMNRKIELKDKWYRDSYGPILAFEKETFQLVALLPRRFSGYYYEDVVSGEKVLINKKNSEKFEKEGLCFYRTLPLKKLGMSDLLIYMKQCLEYSDGALLLALTVAVTLIGMIIPRIINTMTGPIVQSENQGALLLMGICLFCVVLSERLMSSARGLMQKRLEIKTNIGVQSSMMIRLMSLSTGFFREYSAGELKKRVLAVNQLCSKIIGIVLGTGLTCIVSLLYLRQIFVFAPRLVSTTLMIVGITAGMSVLITHWQSKVNQRQMKLSAKESGMSYALISGIQKIKLAGAEKRAFAKWMDSYANQAELQFNPPTVLKLGRVIIIAIALAGNIVLYYMASKNQMEQSNFFTFTIVYGALMGAFSAISDILVDMAEIKPILEMAKPFLEAEPETEDGGQILTELSGKIAIENVSFKYRDEDQYVFKNLSLTIEEGEYVAIVGKTGCGKSTLIRLLLGFEKPKKGAIYFDDKNINQINMTSLRTKIGTVMQDSGLFHGDIYSNIVLSAPELTIEDAWEAAEKAGIAEDIRKMPMGMYTVISEGNGSLSGGQKQRLMIARAIVHKPKILLFDEATSALDSKNQSQVVQTLGQMKGTRIVVAHRLSTIRECDRIVVIDQGRIVEEGTYEELIARGGCFKELVQGQQL